MNTEENFNLSITYQKERSSWFGKKWKKLFNPLKPMIVLGKPSIGKEYKNGHTIIDIINKDYSFETTIKGLTKIYRFEKANKIINDPSKIYKFYPFDKNLI